MYRFEIRNGMLDIIQGDTVFISGVHAFLKIDSYGESEFSISEIRQEDGAVVVLLSRNSVPASLKLIFTEQDNVLLVSVESECRQEFLEDVRAFSPEDGIVLKAQGLHAVDGLMANYLHKPWWCRPWFHTDIHLLPPHTQSLLIRSGDTSSYLLPLCGENFISELRGSSDGVELSLSVCCGGYSQMRGPCLAIGSGQNSFQTVSGTFQAAIEAGAIRVPARSQRKYPEMFEYFGWCSWNAFYHEVNADGILKKLDEFKEKNVPVKWIIIDDGWSQAEDWKLKSFREDRNKFPDGLKALISQIKREYGVRYVGVWHSFNGYWQGIDESNGLYAAEKENLSRTHSGHLLPSFDCGKAFDFWNHWHRYLKEQGVDFLKVDTQSSLRTYAKNNLDPPEAARSLHTALERSVALNFDGSIINCMGMAQENLLSRPQSGISRNSDDFFPDLENGFAEHALQNAYNSVFHNQLYSCDWDMWWTKHDSALQSAVLRAISGGPVYVSDKVGDTQAEMIGPLLDNDGRVLRCDRSAMPTGDCLFTDCTKSGKALKLWNRCGENGVLAAFNIDPSGNETTASISLKDIDGLNGDEYIAYAYFQHRFYHLTGADCVELILPKNGVEIFNFYPVKDSAILLGDTNKYISCACTQKRAFAIRNLILGKE